LFFFSVSFIFDLILDAVWVKAAKTPLADTQQLAVIWIGDFFEKTAEISPTDDKARINVTFKEEVYTAYLKSFEGLTLPSGEEIATTCRSRFIELWNVLYPRYYTQCSCDIPGKCDNCSVIDVGMRTAEDRATIEMFKEAHVLNRGGFFMPQRTK